jgi:aquaporin Z
MIFTLRAPASLTAALRRHWPEYLIEGWALGTFMISAGVFATLLGAPASPLTTRIPDPDLRRVLVGLAMGATAVALIYSPWGKRSGAHMNPAVTLTFLRLGKVAPWDAVFFILAHFAGGIAGVGIAAALLGDAFVTPPVHYAVTAPGRFGVPGALTAEFLISALLMSVILRVSNSPRYAKYTGWCAGVLVATYISVEAPLSGMSMNPARSLASAFPAGLWADLWIYFIAPVLGMQAAAGWYAYRRGIQAVGCAKLQHPSDQRCIHCGFAPPSPASTNPVTPEVQR